MSEIIRMDVNEDWVHNGKATVNINFNLAENEYEKN